MRLLPITLTIMALALLGGCDEPTGPKGKGRIVIEPRGAELLVGDTAVFHFKHYDGRGREQQLVTKDEDGLFLIWWSTPPHEGYAYSLWGFPFRNPQYVVRAESPGKSWVTLGYLGLRDSVEVVVGTNPDISLVSIFAGPGATCGLDAEGTAHCWGGGYGWTHAPLPGGLSYNSILITNGIDCGLNSEREAYCWGVEWSAMLGMGQNRGPAMLPRPVSGGHRYSMLTAGSSHICGLAEDGVAYCWGSHDYGQLGLGKLDDFCDFDSEWYCSSTPAPVVEGHRFRALAAGFWHTCGVTLEYELYCWGLSTNDQFAADSDEVCPDILYGEASCSSVPVRIPGAPPLDTLVAGTWHTCGLTPTGEAYCWGHNGFGELGDGNQPKNSTVPVAVAGEHRFTMLTHKCGLTEVGEVYCWATPGGGAGYATEDCLHGRDLVRCNTVPVLLEGGVRFQTISSNGAHACGIATDGLPYCWGSNGIGELGNGDLLEQRPSRVPVRVLGTK